MTHAIAVAIPCPHCGAECYDSVSKFRDAETGKWSECSWCSTCWLCIHGEEGHVHEPDPWDGEAIPDDVVAARRRAVVP